MSVGSAAPVHLPGPAVRGPRSPSAMASYAVRALYRCSGVRRSTTRRTRSRLLQARSFDNVVKKGRKDRCRSPRSCPRRRADYAPAITRLRDMDVEAVFVCGTAEQKPPFARKAKEMSYRPALIGNQALYDPMLRSRRATPRKARGLPWGVAPDDRALDRAIGRVSRPTTGSFPDRAVPGGLRGGRSRAGRCRKAGTVNPQKVRDALEQMNGYNGLLSAFEMDRKTASARRACRWRSCGSSDGRYTTVEAALIVSQPQKSRPQGGSPVSLDRDRVLGIYLPALYLGTITPPPRGRSAIGDVNA